MSAVSDWDGSVSHHRSKQRAHLARSLEDHYGLIDFVEFCQTLRLFEETIGLSIVRREDYRREPLKHDIGADDVLLVEGVGWWGARNSLVDQPLVEDQETPEGREDFCQDVGRQGVCRTGPLAGGGGSELGEHIVVVESKDRETMRRGEESAEESPGSSAEMAGDVTQIEQSGVEGPAVEI